MNSTKDNILIQAEAFFMKYGFRNVTMDDLCKEMGISFEDDNSLQKAYNDCKTDLSLMMIIAKSKEFENIRIREEEINELRDVLKNKWVFE